MADPRDGDGSIADIIQSLEETLAELVRARVRSISMPSLNQSTPPQEQPVQRPAGAVPDKLYLTTKAKSFHRELKWDISNFSTIFPRTLSDSEQSSPSLLPLKHDGFLMSLGFLGKEFTGLQLNVPLKLSLSGDMINFLSYLQWTGVSSKNLACAIEMQVKTRAGDVVFRKASKRFEVAADGGARKMAFGFDIIKFSEIWERREEIFPDDTLRVRLDLSFTLVEHINFNKQISQNEQLNADAKSGLLKAFAILRNHKESADVKIFCGEETFPVHKVILSARCPYFAKMLSCNMLEAQTGEVTLDQIDPQTVSRLLDFIYSATVSLDGLKAKEISKLALAADRFELLELKKICLNELIMKYMENKNFGWIAVTFYHAGEIDQKEVIWDYCAQNLASLQESSDFLDLLKQYPDAFYRPREIKRERSVENDEYNSQIGGGGPSKKART